MSTESLHEVLRRGRARLIEAGASPATADVDVDVLARHVLGWDRATLLARRRDGAPDGFEAALTPLLARRATREPVAYLTGHREFWGLDFEVTPDVLVPRPETESLVDEAVRGARDSGPDEPWILDVATGSGCVALALASELADARIVAADLSIAALRVAKRNAARLGYADRVRWVASDLVDALRREAPWVDLLVSNPPYVPQGSVQVMPDVHQYEPSMALYGGRDGHVLVARLVVDAAALVRPGGLFIFEFGDGQEDAIREIVARVDAWTIERVRSDLQGIARTAVVRRR